MKTSSERLPLGFFFHNITQFLGAFNDNIYRLFLVFLLYSISPPEMHNKILSIAGALFVLPFLLFSSASGKLADYYSKTSIVKVSKVLEVLVMTAGVVTFYLKSEWGSYTVLFLMAAQSSLFGPAKYGIIPEMIKPRLVPKANGWLSLFSNIAIIMGFFMGSAIADLTEKNFVIAGIFCVIIAIIGTITAFLVPYCPPSGEPLNEPSFAFWKEVYETLKKIKKIPHMLTVVFANAIFFINASYCQLNLINYAVQDLGMTDTGGGYLNPFLAIGIGVGSLLAGKLSKGRLCLSFLPKAGLGVSLCFVLLKFFTFNIYLAVFALFMLGFFGGFFVVPADSFVQMKSEDKSRGQVVAAANFLAFSGVLIGALLIYLIGDVFNLRPSDGFFVMGVLTILLSFICAHFLEDAKDEKSTVS